VENYADHTLLKTAVRLFHKLFDDKTQVRPIGISFSSLTAHPYQQEDLFDLKDSKRWDRLYQGIDQKRKKIWISVHPRCGEFGQSPGEIGQRINWQIHINMLLEIFFK
jgi:hypothetical protein